MAMSCADVQEVCLRAAKSQCFEDSWVVSLSVQQIPDLTDPINLLTLGCL